MNRRFATGLLAILIAANAAAVLLYSGDGPIDTSSINALGDEASWHPILKAIAEGLTLPIPTTHIADIRDGIILIAPGLSLLLLSLYTILTGQSSNPTNNPPRFRNSADLWLQATAVAVLIIASLSALANHRLDLSWGWIARFAAGAGWAILIARSLNTDQVRRATLGLLIVALICLALTIAHRTDHGLAHFTWPIGPITPTAAFAALWASIAIILVMTSLVQIRHPIPPVAPVSNRYEQQVSSADPREPRSILKQFGPTLACGLLLSLISIFVLQQTHRRAPAMGLIAGLLLATAALLWIRHRSRRLGFVLAATGIAGILLAAGYVTTQLRSTDTEASGALALRFAYWKIAMADLVPKHISLGTGPDSFVIEMTNTVAPLRAAAPHFYHGNINFYAHNEWIQAAIELGIPGALFYLALPLGVMVLAWRRLTAQPDDPEPPNGSTRATTLALIAGLTTILVTESASITLRGPMMPVWYWTLLGLLAALNRENLPVPRTSRITLSSPVRCFAFLALGLCCLGLSITDLAHSSADKDPFTPLKQRGRDRLYANKTIVARQQAAVFASTLAKTTNDEKIAAEAVTLWQELYELIPAFRDTPARYAETLLSTNRQDEARRVLEHAIEHLDPYAPESNTLYAQLRSDDPILQLQCVKRAIRNAELNNTLRSILEELVSNPAATDMLETELQRARAAADEKTPPKETDSPAEWLRVAAFLEFRSGQTKQALADQHRAADYYASLEQSNNRYRRGHKAESDVYFTLAQMRFEANIADYPAACEAIRSAERYAVLGIAHEHVAHPEPERGFIGGEVVPTEFPERLFPLWRFSALLHIMTGNEDLLVARILSFLPESKRTNEGVHTALATLYREAHAALTRLPVEKRPAHYHALGEKIRQFTPDSNASGD